VDGASSIRGSGVDGATYFQGSGVGGPVFFCGFSLLGAGISFFCPRRYLFE